METNNPAPFPENRWKSIWKSVWIAIKLAFITLDILIIFPTLIHAYKLYSTDQYKDIDVLATWKNMTIINDIATRDSGKLYQNDKPVAEIIGEPTYQGQDIIFTSVAFNNVTADTMEPDFLNKAIKKVRDQPYDYYDKMSHRFIRVKLLGSESIAYEKHYPKDPLLSFTKARFRHLE